MSKLTPMMRQYHRIKKEHQDAILLFHMGDFYEMFHRDAEEASQILNIALTSRDRHKSDGIPLCGIPCHAAESYINRLLEHGRTVAICDQVEEPSASAGLVKRAVTRVITPGTVLDDRMLEGKSNNFLAAISPGSDLFGLAAVDLSTGEFYLLEVPSSKLQEFEDRLFFFSPAEIILPENSDRDLAEVLSRAAPKVSSPTLVGSEKFDTALSLETLLDHFKTASLDTFGCRGLSEAVTAAGALLAYVQETQRRPLLNLVKLTPFSTGETMVPDSTTQRNLELVGNLEDGRREGSLLSVLDRTVTSMGGRRLRTWVLSPLMDPAAVGERLEAVRELVEQGEGRQRLRTILKEIYDLERLSSRISLNSGSPRDLAALRDSLVMLPALKAMLEGFKSPLLATLATLDTLSDVRERIEERLVEEPPMKIKVGGLIREGFNVELDELRRISSDALAWLSEYEKAERNRSGIATLKVGFNKIYGYYIEITKANLGNLPADYSRRQTLVNAERFHSPELRDFENRVSGAKESIAALEQSLFEELRHGLSSEAKRLQTSAASVASLDVLQSLAETAVVRNYCRPDVGRGYRLDIVDGRHPVVELASEERFVPNDARLDSEGCQIMIITGPNMAGKSTYLRQVALITLMAQIGSFVPARSAVIGLVDRIFTRIGAADRLSRGQSTFMVEMVETAAILHSATPRSLVILDEVGRGTSTFDGLSIAWAIAESLHGDGARGPKTLFATHYHHLTELPLTLSRARNFNIAVKEWESRIVFLRKILEGGTDKSYGIQVAQLAGLPGPTVRRAREILGNLEDGELNLDGVPQLAQPSPSPAQPPPPQMEFFPSPAEALINRLRLLDLENTTPLQALSLLSELKEDIEKNGD